MPARTTPFAPSAKAPQTAIDAAVERLSQCERPYVYVGGGVNTASLTEEVLEIADRLDAPIGCTLMGISTIDTDHPRYVGMQGMHGHFASSIALDEADLVFAVGVRFSDRATGAKTLEMAERQAAAAGVPLYTVVSDPYSYPSLEKAAAKLMAFTVIIEECAELLQKLPLPDFYEEVMTRTGYLQMLEEKGDVESRTRAENVRELKSSILSYMENTETPTLAGFLEEIALYTDIEQYDPDADAVVMMTMHAAKGLEFPNVFLVGLEEGLFPSNRCMSEPEELEEERRLCYVAITRAKQHLVITYARQRMLYGRTTTNLPSRFVDELPAESVKRIGAPKPSYQQTEPRQYGSFGRVSIYGDSYNDFSQIPTRPKPQKDYSVHTAPKPAPKVSFAAGEMVQHKAFGRGMILTVLPMGNDALLEIAFDGVGTKRLMANTAAQHMKKL